MTEVGVDRAVALGRLRALCRERLPGWVERMQWGMPGYGPAGGDAVVSFNSQKQYVALYAGAAVVARFAERLAGVGIAARGVFGFGRRGRWILGWWGRYWMMFGGGRGRVEGGRSRRDLGEGLARRVCFSSPLRIRMGDAPVLRVGKVDDASLLVAWACNTSTPTGILVLRTIKKQSLWTGGISA
jgi:hypothetical protein